MLRDVCPPNDRFLAWHHGNSAGLNQPDPPRRVRTAGGARSRSRVLVAFRRRDQ